MIRLRVPSVSVTALLLSACIASAADEGFKMITSESPYFVVEMPSSTEQSEEAEGSQSRLYWGWHDSVAYSLQMFDFETEAPEFVDPQQFMLWFRQRTLTLDRFVNDKAVVWGESKVPGRAYRYSTVVEAGSDEVEKRTHAHMYFDKSRLYILEVTTRSDWSALETAPVKRFLASFKLAAPKPDERLAAAAAPAGVSFQSAGGRFKATFPARPEESTRQFGSQTHHYASVYADALIYCVSYFDLSAKDTRGQTVQQILQRYQGGATVEGDRDLSPGVQGVRGREYSRDLSSGPIKSQGRYRQFLRRNRMYLVSVIGDAEKLRGPEVEAFLESFELTQ